MVYEKRDYRGHMQCSGLVTFQVMVKETDLWISAHSDLTASAHTRIKESRRIIEQYIRKYPYFLTSLEPLEVASEVPELIRIMAEAGFKTGVGPMASVAGAVAEFVGRGLLRESKEVIVENGGDIFLASENERTVSIFAGKSSFSHNVAIRIPPQRTPMGICTSSGTIGHSKSFGVSDAVTVLSKSTALADAAATAAGNVIKKS